MARTITQSVGKGGINRSDDVKTIQELLNNHAVKIALVQKLTVDGRIGPMTIQAIEKFQKQVVHLNLPDGRVDPAGKTFQALSTGDTLVINTGSVRVVFDHQGKTPEPTSSTKGTDGLYESKVTVHTASPKVVRGSIFPDDMAVKGRLKNGTYPIYLGFHKRQGHTPTVEDLKPKSDGFRAALIVNADRSVPVISNNASKTTSECIHIHNGFNSKRFSEGCPTIHPQDWSNFIKIFLDAHPSLSDWTKLNAYVGKQIGTLEVVG